jgi:hypothetical protein
MEKLVETLLTFLSQKFTMCLLSPTHIQKDGLWEGLLEVIQQ